MRGGVGAALHGEGEGKDTFVPSNFLTIAAVLIHRRFSHASRKSLRNRDDAGFGT